MDHHNAYRSQHWGYQYNRGRHRGVIGNLGLCLCPLLSCLNLPVSREISNISKSGGKSMEDEVGWTIEQFSEMYQRCRAEHGHVQPSFARWLQVMGLHPSIMLCRDTLWMQTQWNICCSFSLTFSFKPTDNMSAWPWLCIQCPLLHTVSILPLFCIISGFSFFHIVCWSSLSYKEVIFTKILARWQITSLSLLTCSKEERRLLDD